MQALCPGFTYSEFHDAMGAERRALASEGFWYSAKFVVDASLDGMRRGKLFVIPGWRYRWMVALMTKLPSAMRLQVEAVGGRVRAQQIAQAQLEG
jgi:short-subunit dehydrogenase